MCEKLIELRSLGLSAAEAMDYWATTDGGYTELELAERYGVSRQAVNQNVNKAKRKIAAQTDK